MPTLSQPSLLPWLFRDDVLVLDTRRLWLRWPVARDGEALQAIAGQREVAEMTATWPHPLPEGEALRRIAKARGEAAAGRSVTLALALRANPTRLVGLIGARALPDGELGLGYLLDPALRGRGLMTEALEGLTRNLFIYTSFEKVQAASRTINPASRRVLEKAGFVYRETGNFDAPARGGAIEVDWFELSRPSRHASARRSGDGLVAGALAS